MYTVYSNNILREVPMDRNTPSSQPEKNIRLPDKALLWIVAFAGFGLLCLILVFVLKPWVLKVLFLLLLAGTAGYLWVMIQSRRMAPGRAGRDAPPAPPAVSEPSQGDEDSQASQDEAPAPAGDEVPWDTDEEGPPQAEFEADAPAQDMPDETDGEEDTEPQAEDAAAADARPAGQSLGMVYVTEKGDKYHHDRECIGLRFADSVETLTPQEAAGLGRTPCSKCAPKAD